MRPIDADAVIDCVDADIAKVKTVIEGKAPYYVGAQMMYIAREVKESIKGYLDKAPTIDYAPAVHGYWKHEEPVKDDGQKPFVCSTCGLRHPRYGDVDKAYFSYCPWCGAQMDEEMDGGKSDG